METDKYQERAERFYMKQPLGMEGRRVWIETLATEFRDVEREAVRESDSLWEWAAGNIEYLAQSTNGKWQCWASRGECTCDPADPYVDCDRHTYMNGTDWPEADTPKEAVRAAQRAEE